MAVDTSSAVNSLKKMVEMLAAIIPYPRILCISNYEGDNPPIGIVLCADKSESVVKYTLPENETQIFASKYKLYLPSEEELLRELNQEYQALEAGKMGEKGPNEIIK